LNKNAVEHQLPVNAWQSSQHSNQTRRQPLQVAKRYLQAKKSTHVS